MAPTPCTASWGWRPTVAHTPPCRPARLSAARDSPASVPMVTRRVTPAWRASSTACEPTPSWVMWQWESVHTRGASLLAGEEGIAPLHGQTSGVPAPGRGPGQALVLGPSRQADAPPQLGAGRGHGRAGQDGHDPERLQRVAHHRVDARTGLGPPRLVGLEVGVGLPDEAPGGLQGVGGREPPPRIVGGPVGLGRHRLQGAAVLGFGADSAALALDHGGHPRQEVPQVVGQVGVVAVDHALVGEVAVGAEGLVPQEVVPVAVDAELGHQVPGRDLVEPGLGHLLPADQQPPVDEDAMGRIDPRGHAHGRPPHAMEAKDLLADEMVHDRPPEGEALGIGAVADGGGVVDEGVVPDVEDVAVGPGDGHAPGERGPGDADVLQALPYEAQRLVALGGGLDRLGIVLVPPEEAVLVAAEPEEVVLLLHEPHRYAGNGAAAVDQLALGVVGLARDAVGPLVGPQLDVPVVVDGLQEALDGQVVAGLARADEVVVGDLEQAPGLPEALHRPVGPLLGGHPVGLRRLGHLEPVLVRPGQEDDVVALEAVPAADGVADHGRVGVAYVGGVVDVIDRRSDVEPAHGRTVPMAIGGASEKWTSRAEWPDASTTSAGSWCRWS